MGASTHEQSTVHFQVALQHAASSITAGSNQDRSSTSTSTMCLGFAMAAAVCSVQRRLRQSRTAREPHQGAWSTSAPWDEKLAAEPSTAHAPSPFGRLPPGMGVRWAFGHARPRAVMSQSQVSCLQKALGQSQHLLLLLPKVDKIIPFFPFFSLLPQSSSVVLPFACLSFFCSHCLFMSKNILHGGQRGTDVLHLCFIFF